MREEMWIRHIITVQLGLYLLSAGILVTQNYTFGIYVVAYVTLTHIYATGSCNNETTEP